MSRTRPPIFQKKKKKKKNVPSFSTTRSLESSASEVIIENGNVLAGTLNQLIMYLSSSDPDNYGGFNFQRTFMLTLQTFTKPENFLEKLVERYNVPYSVDSSNQQLIHIRVCSLV